jgi:hypothetical protein
MSVVFADCIQYSKTFHWQFNHTDHTTVTDKSTNCPFHYTAHILVPAVTFIYNKR